MDGAFELLRTDRYLFWIAVLTVLLNLVNTCGQYLLDLLLTGQADALGLAGADRSQFIGQFYGLLYTSVNALSLALQALAVSRIFRHAGVRGAMFFLPVLALISYSVIAVAPVLAIVRVVKTLENATDYSVQNTVRQAFWLPTSREAKYKAKAAVDTFCTRVGDMSQAGVVYIGNLLALSVSGFAWVLVGFIAIWLYAASQIAREHRKRTL
jgi:AAA family ATP:ADP antiporter